MNYRQTYLKVNLDNLIDNYNLLKNTFNKAIFAVVKADGYGLGALEITKALVKENVAYLAVSSLEEALKIRVQDKSIPILVFGYVAPKDASVALENNLTLTCHSLIWAQEITQLNYQKLKIHLKLDTGMNRIGIIDADEARQAAKLLQTQHVLEGIYTHYASGHDLTITRKQFQKFKSIVESIDYSFKWIHAANSSGSFTLNESFTNAIRPGLALYGYLNKLNLKPVASLYSRISHLKTLPKNSPISYEGHYITNKETTIIATLPLGYADGINPIAGKRYVAINKKKYPIVGTICMDQLMIELDQFYPLNIEVEIFGDTISMEEYCQATGETAYHVISHLTNRVPRLYQQNKI